jgi:hypothetical protein
MSWPVRYLETAHKPITEDTIFNMHPILPLHIFPELVLTPHGIKLDGVR